MMKMMKKIIMLVLLTMFVGVEAVNAVTFGVNDKHNIRPSTPSTDTGEKEPTIGFTETVDTAWNKKTTYQCKYYYNTETWVQTSINIYDDEYYDAEKSLIPSSFKFPSDYQALAGTAIGISFVDIRTVKWWVNTDEVWVEETTDTVIYDETEVITGYNCKYRFVPLNKKPNIKETPLSNTSGDDAEEKFSAQINTLSNTTESIAVTGKCADKEVETLSECAEKATIACKYTGNYEVIKETKVEKIINTTTSKNTNKAMLTKCREQAINDAVGTNSEKDGWGYSGNGKLTWEAAYTVDITNSNDINGDNITISAADANKEKSKWKCYNSNNELVGECKFNANSNYISDMVKKLETENVVDIMTVHREYKKEKTCIDVTTGKVSYVPGYDEKGNKKTDCDSQTEFTIENGFDKDGNEYWHYFIPLNAKSTSDVEIDTMMDWDGTIDEDTCKKYLIAYPVDKKNPDAVKYTDLVVKYNKNNGTVEDFKGNYYGYNSDASSDWQTLDNMKDSDENEDTACRLTTKVKIPITQGYYNEVTTDSSGKKVVTFNGFNFYYKPIDPNNDNQIDVIFPNGVTTDTNGDITTATLWSDWYKAQTNPGAYPESKGPNLSESYSVVTYVAQNIDTSTIRKYNANNPYTSWSNMNVDGTSNYIELEGIITRNSGVTDNIYKLGCGPSNMLEYNDDGTKNSLYQAECAK